MIVAAMLMLSAFVMAQNTKKVAILETVDKENRVEYGVELQLRGYLTDAINRTPGYEGYDRVDMASIMGEHNFQRTGYVSDAQIKKLGQMTGASSIIVAEAAMYGSDRIIVTAKIIDVESARIENTSRPKVASTSDDGMAKACAELAIELLGMTKSSGSSSYGNSNIPYSAGASTLTIRVGNVSFDMIKVEAGTFTMGCTSEQSECYSGESPYHRVTISSDYYIGKYEVTQELWQAVMGNNPSSFKGFDKPVENVSWNDCVEFCEELSRMTGKRFRLPTEAEWEFAARGGKKSTGAKYSGSSSVANVAWYDGSSGGQTHPVGKLRPNELGIYDMSGNVWEWCSDWYGSYGSSSQTDPYGASSGQSRVLRGGSWFSGARYCRVSNRDGITPSGRDDYYGFRVVLVP